MSVWSITFSLTHFFELKKLFRYCGCLQLLCAFVNKPPVATTVSEGLSTFSTRHIYLISSLLEPNIPRRLPNTICDKSKVPPPFFLCHQDVVELLEKRVKSRFSHRRIHVFNTLNFPEYKEAFQRMLTLPSDLKDPKFVKRWNKDVEVRP